MKLPVCRTSFWGRLTGLGESSSSAATAVPEIAAATSVRCYSSTGGAQIDRNLTEHAFEARQDSQSPFDRSSSSCISSNPFNSTTNSCSSATTSQPPWYPSHLMHPAAQWQHPDTHLPARQHTVSVWSGSSLDLNLSTPRHHDVPRVAAAHDHHLCNHSCTSLHHHSRLMGVLPSCIGGLNSLHIFRHNSTSSGSNTTEAGSSAGKHHSGHLGDSSKDVPISAASVEPLEVSSHSKPSLSSMAEDVTSSGSVPGTACATPDQFTTAVASAPGNVNTTTPHAQAVAEAAAEAAAHKTGSLTDKEGAALRSVDALASVPEGTAATSNKKKSSKQWDEDDDEDDDEAWTVPVPLDPEAEEQPGIVYLLAAAVASSVMAVTVAGLLMAGTFYAGLYLNGVMRQVDHNKQHRAAQHMEDTLPPPLMDTPKNFTETA